MAGKATLQVQILVDAAKAAAGLNETASKFESFASKATKFLAGAFVADKIIGGLKTVTMAASDMEQAVGATDKVFGASSSQIHKWAADTEDAIRIPAAAFEKLAVGIGVQLQAAGFTAEQSVGKIGNLMSAAADVAAGMGKSVEEVGAAMRSAFAGEYDPIQNLGIAINDVAVRTEAARLATQNGTSATDAATLAQARYNLILQGAAVFQGQAAAEANSFAGRMDSLKEKLQNAAVQIGGPLLDAFGGLIDSMAAAIPIFSPIITGLTQMVAGFAQLPAPVLAAVAAITALVFVVGPVAGLVKTFVAAFVGIQAAIVSVQALGLAAGVAIGGLRAAFIAAQAAIVSFFTTPVGWVTMGVAATLAAIAGVLLVLGENARSAAEDQKRLEESIKSMADVANRGGSQLEYAQQALKELNKEGQFKSFKDGQELADALGVSLGDLTSIVAGAGGSISDVISKFDGLIAAKQAEMDQSGQSVDGAFVYNAALQKEIDALEHDKNAILKLADAKNQGIALSDREAAAIAQATGQTLEHVKAVNEAAVADKEWQVATDNVNKAVSGMKVHSEIIASMTEVNRLLEDRAAAQDAVARGTDALNLMFEQADARNSSYEKSVLGTTTAITGLGKGLKEAHDNGKPVADLIANWDWGGIRREMPDVASGLLDVRTSMGESTMAAFEAGGGFKDFSGGLAAASVQMKQNEDDFRGMLHAAGLTDDEINQVVGSMDEFNQTDLEEKLAKIKADDFEARKTALFWSSIQFDPIEQKYVSVMPDPSDILGQLNATLPKTPPEVPLKPIIGQPVYPAGALGTALQGGTATAGTINIPAQVRLSTAHGSESLSDQSFGRLYDPAGLKPIIIPASVTPANPLQPVQQSAAALNGQTVTVQVQAGTTAAQGAITALVTQSRTLTIQVTANPAQAQGSIAAVTGGAYTATVRVLGENSAAIGSIRNVTTGVYSTTIRVLGDNNAAISSIRSVTTGRYDTTVFVGGDNNGAISSIRNITTGRYTATVYIGANTDAFYSAWNSLPTSRTITVTVNQVQGSVVAPPAAPGGLNASAAAAPVADLMAFAAAPRVPALRTGKAAKTAGSTATTNITIEAGIGDPDAIARAVKRVVLGRDRRTGGVVVGEMRSRVGHS